MPTNQYYNLRLNKSKSVQLCFLMSVLWWWPAVTPIGRNDLEKRIIKLCPHTQFRWIRTVWSLDANISLLSRGFMVDEDETFHSRMNWYWDVWPRFLTSALLMQGVLWPAFTTLIARHWLSTTDILSRCCQLLMASTLSTPYSRFVLTLILCRR